MKLDPRDVLTFYRTTFSLFATKAFTIVNPGQTFVGTGAFLAMAHALAEVEAGRMQRLLITVPPRSGKSLLASIALPAYILGRDPTRRIICASYSGELAAKLARDCRTVMTDRSYRLLFPGTVMAGKNTESEFETSRGGFRYATSVGGTLTGRGGNVIIIDDAMKPDEAMSRVARERVWEWFTGTVGSRLDNKAEDAIVLVMQRLHVDDLVGRLLDRGGWDHLRIPAIAETEQSLPIGAGQFFTRAPGDVLDSQREPRDVLEQIRRELGSATFEAQYQQQPVPEEGGLVQWRWFASYDRAPGREPGDWVVISWDSRHRGPRGERLLRRHRGDRQAERSGLHPGRHSRSRGLSDAAQANRRGSSQAPGHHDLDRGRRLRHVAHSRSPRPHSHRRDEAGRGQGGSVADGHPR
jgi:hypothetical protein